MERRAAQPRPNWQKPAKTHGLFPAPPTALAEAAVAQWFWLTDLDPQGDQFNSIHEHLIDAWKQLRQRDDSPIHFSALSGVVEDYVTVEYLRDTAIQAGFDTDYLDVEQIGWNARLRRFVDGARAAHPSAVQALPVGVAAPPRPPPPRSPTPRHPH